MPQTKKLTRRVTINLNEQLYVEACAHATEQEIPLASFVRRAIRLAMFADAQAPRIETRVEAAVPDRVAGTPRRAELITPALISVGR